MDVHDSAILTDREYLPAGRRFYLFQKHCPRLRIISRVQPIKERDVARTDQQIVDQTNELAKALYALRGYTVRDGYRFDKATHPHEVEAWQGACHAQILLTGTDPADALDNLDEGE